MKGAIRFAVEKQLRSFETQCEQGAFVHRLIALAESLLLRVREVSARRPASGDVQTWFRRPMRTEVFFEGLQATDWTVEERGLAGLGDLEGIPWTMPMEQFFEAWVETVMQAVSQRTGGLLKVGRRRETVSALAWQPPYVGSQRSLIPDLILEMEDVAVLHRVLFLLRNSLDSSRARAWNRPWIGGPRSFSSRTAAEPIRPMISCASERPFATIN